MNRREFATKIQDLINRAYLADIPKSYYEGLFDEAEKLCQPITLADLLGWEEDVEYDYKDLYVLKVENNRLFMKSEKCSSGWCNFALLTDEIEELQQATKVESKLKAYHVKDEYSFSELMKELEEQGYVWFPNVKPTEFNYDDVKLDDGVIIFDEEENNVLEFTGVRSFEDYYKSEYNLIEYHKEPLYYATTEVTKKVYITDENGEKIKLTKREWEEQMIHDKTASLEEVEE